MGIELVFEWDGKSSPDNIHFGVRDGCEVDVEESFYDLSDDQRLIFSSDKKPPDKSFLWYKSCWLTESLMNNTGKIEINCPVCKNTYVLTRKEYDDAKYAYLEQRLKS